ncbi:hypothetical protein WA158_000678 [Blastocystis sp. Blastoise]
MTQISDFWPLLIPAFFYLILVVAILYQHIVTRNEISQDASFGLEIKKYVYSIYGMLAVLRVIFCIYNILGLDSYSKITIYINEILDNLSTLVNLTAAFIMVAFFTQMQIVLTGASCPNFKVFIVIIISSTFIISIGTMITSLFTYEIVDLLKYIRIENLIYECGYVLVSLIALLMILRSVYQLHLASSSIRKLTVILVMCFCVFMITCTHDILFITRVVCYDRFSFIFFGQSYSKLYEYIYTSCYLIICEILPIILLLLSLVKPKTHQDNEQNIQLITQNSQTFSAAPGDLSYV